jgi:KUP system potassium uptake protein
MNQTSEQSAIRGRKLLMLTVGALGIVYGDIGTSPLYAMRETFESPGHVVAITDESVLGALSLIFWALVIVISIKYLMFVMRADNHGEGGILALTSLARPTDGSPGRRRVVLILIGLFGTALLYGDGMITPAISVLSAVEGTAVVTDSMEPFVIPIAIAILLGLFAVQSRGTGGLGSIFGPIMAVWFVTIGTLGAIQVVGDPDVLAAVNPAHAITFFADNGFTAFLALGSIFLVVTGGEALYADMGHFGKHPITVGWFWFVLPALLLNYFGQGALLLSDPSVIENPFFKMAPTWGLIPLVVLATVATVIASQALISGAFSLTMQATQLGYSPRVRIRHTSSTEMGQIYVPAVNWALMVACIALVLGFRSSTNLAAAYGVAVTATMVITTLLFYVVARDRFRWPRLATAALCGAFLVVDLGFFGANLFKIPAGGWFPLVVGGLVFTLLTTWRTGREILAERLGAGRVPLDRYLKSLADHPPTRVPGQAVYLYGSPGGTPPSLMANLRHNNALHETIVILSVATEPVPRVPGAKRLTSTDLGQGFSAAVVHFGYMEDPDVVMALQEHGVDQLGLAMGTTTYVLGRENLRVTDRPGMAKWREHLFAFMSRNATPAANYFALPPDQTVEIGVQVEL